MSDYLLFPMVETRDVLGAYPASLLLVCPAGRVLLHLDSQARPGAVHGSTWLCMAVHCCAWLPSLGAGAAAWLPHHQLKGPAFATHTCLRLGVLLCSAAPWWIAARR